MRRCQQVERAGRNVCSAAMVLLLMVGGGLLGCDPDRTDAVNLFNQGMQAYEGEGPGAAAGYMEQALEVDPTFVDAAYTLGQIQHMELEDPEAAEDSFRQARDHDPDSPAITYRLASALSAQGEYEDAIEFYRETLEEEPGYARGWFEKGQAYDAAGESMKAVESLMEAIELNPRLRLDEDDIGGEHYHALGDLYLRFRLYDHAADVYANGVENNPESSRLHHGLGIAQMEMERHDDAIASLEEALDIDENHSSANFNYAVALAEGGDLDAAIEQLEHVVDGGVRDMTEARTAAASARLDDLKAERDEE